MGHHLSYYYSYISSMPLCVERKETSIDITERSSVSHSNTFFAAFFGVSTSNFRWYSPAVCHRYIHADQHQFSRGLAFHWVYWCSASAHSSDLDYAFKLFCFGGMCLCVCFINSSDKQDMGLGVVSSCHETAAVMFEKWSNKNLKYVSLFGCLWPGPMAKWYSLWKRN